jgi:hypothetical protein
MAREPAASFQRADALGRGPIVQDLGRLVQPSDLRFAILREVGAVLTAREITSIIQDPDFYFRVNFADR